MRAMQSICIIVIFLNIISIKYDQIIENAFFI